jgi:Cd2+/Zn2+-exporting ATPase
MAKIKKLIQTIAKQDECKCSGSDSCSGSEPSGFGKYLPALVCFGLLAAGILFDFFDKNSLFIRERRLIWYIVAYLPVGFPVIKEAFRLAIRKDFFNEFTLMSVATLGAFFIGEYPEGVAVMLFYTVGEMFQESAVNKARSNIKALLDIRPDRATVLRGDKYVSVSPEKVDIGETIQVKAGEKAPLDGTLLSVFGSFNTAALTGESIPKTIREGESVLAGMVNLDKVIEIKVERKYSDSSLARILEMVQNATSRKAKTELLIRKFAHIYTPVVFFFALAIVVVPCFAIADYVFSDWLYRALVFLVISCPCALVVSIPLSYFGGIGAASRAGILFKGANYLDLMTKVNTVVMDKTGTLTEGVFRVQQIVTDGMDRKEFMKILTALESQSTHPIAKAVVEYENDETEIYTASEVQEIAGHGLKGKVNGDNVLAGNTKLLKKFDVAYDASIDDIVESIVVMAVNNQYAGYVLIADKVKEDAKQAIAQMRQTGITQTLMLSGDKNSITQKIAANIGIDFAFGDLLPEDKVQKLEDLKRDNTKTVAFVGDGINDAPVLALSDIGIAMGGMGADAAIETADVVIQTDQPSKVATAIGIAKATKQIVFQNIALALGIKVIILSLGIFGIATMWMAVFADVGVSLITILNAIRMLKRDF